MRGVRSPWKIGAVRLAVTVCILGVGAASAAFAQPDLAGNPAEPATSPPLPPNLVEGPEGVLLFESGPTDPGGASIEFVQIADGRTTGKVMGADRTFDTDRLPATFRMTFNGNGGACTATLIGPRVLLTAAHCVDAKEKDQNGEWKTIPGSVRLSREPAPRPIRTCMMAPAYLEVKPPLGRKPRNAADYALCELGAPLEVKAESISRDAAKLEGGRSIMLAGYGCTEEVLIQGRLPPVTGSSETLTVGMNTVAASGHEGWSTSLGRVGRRDQAIICPGDSGGAVYADASIAVGADNRRRVSAVNSAVGPSAAQAARWRAAQPSPEGPEYVSYLSPLSAPAFGDLLTRFMAADPPNRTICGVNVSALLQKCRL